MSDVTPIVFVVDDDVSVRESLEALIREAGWQPETFASAEAFLSNPRVPGPSCLVLDGTLPGLNGLDLNRDLRIPRAGGPDATEDFQGEADFLRQFAKTRWPFVKCQTARATSASDIRQVCAPPVTRRRR